MKTKDKLIEKKRYDLSAMKLQKNSEQVQNEIWGKNKSYSSFLKYYLKSPYEFFEECIESYVSEGSIALEIGSGTGNFTGQVANRVRSVIASDISTISLEVSSKRHENFNNIEYKEADMENLPFQDGTFDIIFSAGSMSYGDVTLVKQEVHRTLKKGGLFICVDSLNNNPIYRVRRLIAFLIGGRSKSTLKNMPTINKIGELEQEFICLEKKFFGSMSWVLALFPNISFTQSLSDKIDKILKCKKSAFKFVIVLKKK